MKLSKNRLPRSIFSLVFVVAVLVQSSSSSEDPCVTATDIGNSNRTTTEDPGTCGGLCDNFIVNGSWYRLDVSNSGVQMPESCVPVWRCGTYIPIWLNGAHPTETNQISTNVRVCAQLKINGDCCEWSGNINVKRCEDAAVYFVYQLIRPPYCDMAYCAGSGPNCGGSGSWNDLTQSCTTAPYPTLDQNPTLIGPYISQTANTRDISGKTFTATSFSLKCKLSYVQRSTDDGARYDVLFETTGGVVYRKTLKSTDVPEVEMSESYLVGHVDQNVFCRATAYWQSAFPKRSLYKLSNSVYIGFKLSANTNEITGPLPVAEGDKVTVTVQPTFPITTPACLNSGVTPCSPTYTFRVYADRLYLSNCTFSVSNGSTASFVFSPIANLDKYPSRVGTFQLIPDNTIQAQGSIFNDYKSNKLSVSIIERDWPRCSSSGDPHVTTFNGAYYHIYGSGEYVLVSIPSRKIEVQVSHTPCGTVSCNCGVIAREGNNILGINNCPTQTSVAFTRYLTDVNNPGGYIYSSNSNYKTIVLPSGMRISVLVPGYVGYISVDVDMYGLDGTVYQDICSNRLTSYDAECGSECDQYKVRGTNFFNIREGTQSLCDASALLVPQCDCTSGGGTTGSTCPMPNGDVPLLTVPNTCNLPLNAKRKRSFPDDDNAVTVAMPSAITPPRNVALPASSSNVGSDQALAACNSAVTASSLYALCITNLRTNISIDLQSCVLDVQILGDLVLPPMLLAKQMENRCKTVIVSSDSAVKDSNIKTYNDNYCSTGCSTTGGNCVQGTCQCYSEYQSSDCSVRRGVVPTIINLQAAVCNIRDTTNPAGCNVVFISARDVSDNTLTCKITETTSGKVLQNPAGRRAVVTLGSVACPLPDLPISLQLSRDYSLLSYSINVSLSNDESAYSNSMKFTVYDGLNLICDATGCERRSGSPRLNGANSVVALMSLFVTFIRVLHELI